MHGTVNQVETETGAAEDLIEIETDRRSSLSLEPEAQQMNMVSLSYYGKSSKAAELIHSLSEENKSFEGC
jgi:hypothetical protein